MSRRAVFDHDRLACILNAQHQVITRAQGLGCGIPRSTITSWCRPDGKWQKLLPGVYLTVTGQPADEQRLMAALLYGGPRSVITGPAALRAYGLRVPGPDVTDLLVPMATRRQSAGYLRIHRTRDLPRPRRLGPLRYAEPARAIVDAAQHLASVDDVHAVVTEAIQRQACNLLQLRLEQKRVRARDISLLRIVLEDIQASSRSVTEVSLYAGLRAGRPADSAASSSCLS
jgi:hypothetical protein